MKRLFYLLVFLSFFCSYTFAEEVILSYDIDIHIKEDSSLRIIEEIKVRAEGKKIKRGIYRDFPTSYRDSNGTYRTVGFNVDFVIRDGVREDYHVVRRGNGRRVYIGNKYRYLKNGIYTYKIVFNTNRQLGYFKKHDELYFNAIGTGWDFKINKANVNVFFPKEINTNRVRLKAFTGPQGAVGDDYEAGFNSEKNVFFYTTRKLYEREGLTIVVGFQKGIVKELTSSENFFLWVQDNIFFLCALLFSILGIGVHGFLWKRHGKDPKGRTIYPLFETPNDMPPYALPYIEHMKLAKNCLPSLIIKLAVKDHIKIAESEGSFFRRPEITLHRKKSKEQLSGFEHGAKSKIFLHSDRIICKPTNYEQMLSAKKSLETHLKSNYSRYFRKNGFFILPGLTLQAIGFFVLKSAGYGFIIAPYLFINVIFLTIFALIMKTYTREGRDVMDKIEGYKMYLETAEKGRFDDVPDLELTDSHFEKHLPFAIALGVEANWVRAFANALEKMGRDLSEYQPRYYSGRSFSDSSAFKGGSYAFANTIASASTPPGSSSGFSGGSSGGGGGGGGGGGW